MNTEHLILPVFFGADPTDLGVSFDALVRVWDNGMRDAFRITLMDPHARGIAEEDMTAMFGPRDTESDVWAAWDTFIASLKTLRN